MNSQKLHPQPTDSSFQSRPASRLIKLCRTLPYINLKTVLLGGYCCVFFFQWSCSTCQLVKKIQLIFFPYESNHYTNHLHHLQGLIEDSGLYITQVDPVIERLHTQVKTLNPACPEPPFCLTLPHVAISQAHMEGRRDPSTSFWEYSKYMPFIPTRLSK